MSEYVNQALEFLNSCPAECSIVLVGPSFPDWDNKHLHNMYCVTLKTRNGRYDFNFWDSIYNAEHKKKPTVYDVLSCLSAYDPGTFSDFCDEFGYSNDSISALKTYTAVCDEYRNLCRIFTRQQLKKLAEIQ